MLWPGGSRSSDGGGSYTVHLTDLDMPNTVFGRPDLSAFTHNQGTQPAGCTTQRCEQEHLGCEHRKAPGRVARGFPSAGADDGNRTRVICLEGRGSTIELHPRTPGGDTPILPGIVHVRDI